MDVLNICQSLASGQPHNAPGLPKGGHGSRRNVGGRVSVKIALTIAMRGKTNNAIADRRWESGPLWRNPGSEPHCDASGAALADNPYTG